MIATRANMLRRATESVLALEIKDFNKGLCDEAWLREMAQRRAPAIAAAYAEMARDAEAPPAKCADCGAPGTTKMGGADYCAVHASAHKKEDPRS